MNTYSLTKNIWLPCLVVLIAACQHEADKTVVSNSNKFSDSVLVNIYEYQDHRNTQGLLQYFNDENPSYRAAAAEAFGSVQDSLAIPMLANLLADQYAKVRKAAAYALGQTYDSSAIGPLNAALANEDSVFVKRALFEALGKVITQPQIHLLNLRPTESDLEAEGLAWGLYRAGLRNVHNDLSVGTAIVLLAGENSYLTRLGAAHFLARTPNLELSSYLPQIIQAATTDSAANVRMAATSALGKIQTPSAVETLATQCIKDLDYRVRINAIRALNNPQFRVKDAIYESLEDKNINVAIAAASWINSQGESADYITELALKHNNNRVKAMLLGAALSASENKTDLNDQIQAEFENATDPYLQANLLHALSSDLNNFQFIVTKTFEAIHPAVSTAGANALVALRRKKPFPNELEESFADVFRQLIETSDIAIVAIISGLLADANYNFTKAYDNHQFLIEAKNNLSLPKDNEALQILNKAIALFEGKDELPETKNDFNNPINWELVKSIDADQTVTINTDKGEITLRLLVEEAPGSVANFYILAQQGYFNGKNFHRVVPNFVVQGGCNRGDGYGGENYSIRSEFADLRYQTGSVGMASAGKDTEGTQWFITHSPTPHLDGRYTIFAQVESGMEIVHKLEVGDVIESIEIYNDDL